MGSSGLCVAVTAIMMTLAPAAAFAECAKPVKTKGNPTKRPVVFIPGVIGSVLENDDGVVWGDRWSLSRFESLEIPKGPVDPTDGIEPSRIVDSIQVLGPWSVGQYSPLRELFVKKLGYKLGVEYFEYPYDWRQSNFTSADCFAGWVEGTLGDREFDLVAHSMGGIVAEIFIKTQPRGRQVRRFITMGTPYLGAVDILAMIDGGWGWYANWMSGGMPKIRRIMLSFPSLYELLPSYQFCCSLVAADGETRDDLKLQTAAGWRRIVWETAPGNEPPAARVEHALKESRRLKKLIAESIDDHIPPQELFRVATRKQLTKGRIRVDQVTGKILEFSEFLGDGTVIFRSATKCPNRSDKGCGARSDLSFAKHSQIFDDPSAIERLMRVFGDVGGGPDEYGSDSVSFVTSDERPFEMKSVSLAIEPQILEPGQPFTLTLKLESEKSAPVEDVPVSFAILSGSGAAQKLAASKPSTEDVGGSRIAAFTASGNAPEMAGGFTVRATMLVKEQGVARPLVLDELAMVFGSPEGVTP